MAPGNLVTDHIFLFTLAVGNINRTECCLLTYPTGYIFFSPLLFFFIHSCVVILLSTDFESLLKICLVPNID